MTPSPDAPVTARWVGMDNASQTPALSRVWLTYHGSRKGKVLNEGDMIDINGTNARILGFVGDALKSRPMYALVTSDDQSVFFAKFIEIMRGFGNKFDDDYQDSS